MLHRTMLRRQRTCLQVKQGEKDTPLRTNCNTRQASRSPEVIIVRLRKACCKVPGTRTVTGAAGLPGRSSKHNLQQATRNWVQVAQKTRCAPKQPKGQAMLAQAFTRGCHHVESCCASQHGPSAGAFRRSPQLLSLGPTVQALLALGLRRGTRIIRSW